MKEDKPSFSAMTTAYIRVYHSVHDTPKIFDDFLADRLIPEKVRELFKQGLKDKQFNDLEHTASLSNHTNAFASLMKATNVLSRARYTEDALERV
jgi:O-methyltransferase involved in polyketide biosynthesis